MTVMKFIQKNWPILLLLSLALCVRLYRLPETMTFLEDEGRDMLIVKRMVDTGKPVLIGPQTSTGNMYLGPFYYYFIAPALVLAGMNPVGPAVLIAITGVVTVYLLYRWGSEWFGWRTGWVASSMYAFLPLPVTFTRNSWNPNLAPLVSLLIIGVLVRVRDPKKTEIKWVGVLGILCGLLVQLHYMALIMVGLVALIVCAWWFRSRKFAKAILIGMAGFLISLAPFFIFELRNDWVNSRAILRFVEAREDHTLRYSLPLSLWWNKVSYNTESLVGSLFARTSFVAEDPAETMITVFVLGLIALALITGRGDRKLRAALAVIIFGSLVTLGIYQENVHRHYLGYLFPLTYLAYASLLSHRSSGIRLAGAAATILIMGYGLPVTYDALRAGSTHQMVKAENIAQYIAQKAEGRAYNLVSTATTNTTPYQYYAHISGHPPTTDAADSVFIICEGMPCSEADLSNRQMFVTGPAHPTLGSYVGHPLATYIAEDMRTVSNEHVSIGTWVAEVELKSPDEN